MTAVPILELDRFYFHFKSLLFSGFKASLVVNSDNGEASVTLTAGLGPLNNCKVVRKKKRSPSYLRRLDKRRNDRNNVVANEEIAEKVNSSDNVDAAADEFIATTVTETPQFIAEEVITAGETVSDEVTMEIEAVKATSVDGKKQEKTGCDEDTIENDAVEAASSLDVGAEKQERRFWLCIFHGCIDNTTLEDLQCSCCGDECQVVEYDSEVEYEPD